MTYIYNLIMFPLLLVLLPVLLAGLIVVKKWRAGLGQRLGMNSLKKNGKENVIWFHAASVGEVQALVPVVNEMKKLKPGSMIAVTTTSVNGLKKIKTELSGVLYYSSLIPFDLPLLIGSFIDKLKPAVLVIVETEIWPNLIAGAKRRKIPVLMINGRISVKSFRLYYPLRMFFGHVLDMFDILLVQSEKMKIRLKALGVKENKIVIMSNTKYSSGGEDGVKSRIQLKKNGKKIIVAGSIRKGEERAVIGAVRRIKSMNAVAILAPRHMNRVKKVREKLIEEGLSYIMWTDLTDYSSIFNYDAVILNTIGELQHIYPVGDIAIIGGGFKKYGGHNPMEAAMAKLPVIMGRHMYNFEDTADRFVKAGGAFMTDNSDEKIAGHLKFLLENDDKRAEMGNTNREIIEKFRGSAESTAVIINEVILENRD